MLQMRFIQMRYPKCIKNIHILTQDFNHFNMIQIWDLTDMWIFLWFIQIDLVGKKTTSAEW